MRRKTEAIVADTNILMRGLERIRPEEQILQVIELNDWRRVFAVMSPSMKDEAEVVARIKHGVESGEYARILSIIGLAIGVPDYRGEIYPVGHNRDFKIVDAARRANAPIVSEDHHLTDHAGILKRDYRIVVYDAYGYYEKVVRDLLASGIAGK